MIAKLSETEMVALIAYLQKIGTYEIRDAKDKKEALIKTPDMIREEKDKNKEIEKGTN